MNMLIMLAIGLSAWDFSLNPEAHQAFLQAKSSYVGTWLRTDRGMKVKIKNTHDKLFIRVAYLGTYGEYKPWPEIAELTIYTEQPKSSPAKVRATAQWSFDDWQIAWTLRQEGNRLRVEEYSQDPNLRRRNHFSVDRYNKVVDEPWDDDEWARKMASALVTSPLATIASLIANMSLNWRTKSARLTEWLPSLLATLLGVVLAFIARGNLALVAAVPFAAAPMLLAWPTRNWSGPWAYLVLYAAGIAEFFLFGNVIGSAIPNFQPSFGDAAILLSVFSLSAIMTFVLRLRLASDRLMVSIGEKITILLVVALTYLPLNILMLYLSLAETYD